MKESLILSTRACAGLVGVALFASCGAGTETGGTTAVTRNTGSSWVATTEPVKAVVFGTQDGLVELVHVPGMSATVESTNITTVPGSAAGNTISMVAFDTASDDVVFGGNMPTSGVFVARMNIKDSTPTEVFSTRSGFFLGGGFDPMGRSMVFTYSDLGSLTYVVGSVDEQDPTVVKRTIPFYAIVNFDGSRALMTSGTDIREVEIGDPTISTRSTRVLATTPFDLWGFVKDPLSEAVYGARQSQGEILVGNLAGSRGTLTQVGKTANPSSLAAFSDGTLVAGTGAALNAPARYKGKLTVIDPAGKVAEVKMTVRTGAGSVAPVAGVQSVWAIESPVSTAAPKVSVDGNGNLECTDAIWRGDLPLSRLSRAPSRTARSFAWFRNGKRVGEESSGTLVPTGTGNYSCAAIANNIAGTGYSAQSAPFSFVTPTTSSAAK